MPIIVITGASAGIGAAVAKRFAKEEYTVVLLARRQEKLTALVQEIGPKKAFAFPTDVTRRSQVQSSFTAIEEQVGPIDILVNNAGAAFGLEKAQDGILDDWEKCIDINIKGVTYCTHAVLPQMVKRNRGHIINLGSIAGQYAYPGGNIYCGTKAFLHRFSLCLRSDLIGTAVRVSCIEPGLVGGTEFSDVRFRGDHEKARQVYNRTRPLTPEDIAEALYFCAAAPAHVNINTIELMPVCQAPAALALDRT